MVCFRTDWAALGVALATGTLNATPAGFRRGGAGLRRPDACGAVGESAPAVIPTAAR